MTDSVVAPKSRSGKRERLVDAAVRVFYEQGVERTTIADIAREADVPVGNVYYYFKTKEQFVRAVIDAHAQRLDALIAELATLPGPAERLEAMIGGWVDQREMAARFGCPFGSLAAELDKRADGTDAEAATVLRRLVDWAASQFAELGRDDADRLAVAFIAAYQGISVLTNAFRDPELMRAEGERLGEWVRALAG
ncbi:TetR/AcrR family transcriptional regulator [Nocardia thailandica]|uniref:TetR/AcrR family transcriptional regulator n=1 Tax=Nocardia thailandica TaxID=257275 RepID=A0ABW6PPJ7_9NOCA